MNRAIILALALTSCGGNVTPIAPGWTAGPFTDGTDYSAGTIVSDNVIMIPAAPQSTHYVTRPCDLNGKSKITLDYTFTGTATPASDPAAPSMISLYFQRRGDDWASDGWRWYAAFAMDSPITPGAHEIVAPLDGAWSSVMTMTAASNPQEFAAAKADVGVCGFVLGGGTGLGHGVIGPATLTVTSFTVE